MNIPLQDILYINMKYLIISLFRVAIKREIDVLCVCTPLFNSLPRG